MTTLHSISRRELRKPKYSTESSAAGAVDISLPSPTGGVLPQKGQVVSLRLRLRPQFEHGPNREEGEAEGVGTG